MADTAAILRSTARIPEHVIYRSFEAETVLLNLQTGQYHGLNRTGGRLLELLKEHQGTIGEAIDRLATAAGRRPDEIEGELADFCAALAERGLIEIHEPVER
jgi:Coenzyme PQQ synthesis protein D (PqqD)